MTGLLKPNSNMQMLTVESEDIDDRVSWIIEEIHEGKRDPRVRQIGSDILSKKKGDAWAIPERDWLGEVTAVFNYIRSNVRFTRDPHEVELFQKARRTLELKIADCDDLVILSGSILQSVGYPILIRVIAVGSRIFSHVYILVGIPPHDPEKYIPFDTSRQEGIGWELREGVLKKQDYEVSEED